MWHRRGKSGEGWEEKGKKGVKREVERGNRVGVIGVVRGRSHLSLVRRKKSEAERSESLGKGGKRDETDGMGGPANCGCSRWWRMWGCDVGGWGVCENARLGRGADGGGKGRGIFKTHNSEVSMQ